MLSVFKEHIRTKALFDHSQRYLLACSGGVDSMVLGNLLLSCGISFEVAHVNFGLRGKESDQDAQFVENWCEAKGLTFYKHCPDTESYANKQSYSIQMAAREIRYAWFEWLRADHGFEGIVLAHHQDDQLETIFLNLIRGTGLDGIQGMSSRNGRLIRPLLHFSKEEICNYAIEIGLEWREDQSNQEIYYKRNNLRMEALPALYAVKDDVKKNLQGSFSRIADAGKALHSLSQEWQQEWVIQSGDYQVLPLRAFVYRAGAVTILFYWLRGFGFLADQCESILQAAKNKGTGSQFFSKSHVLNIDREELLLVPIRPTFEEFSITQSDIELVLPGCIYEILKIPASGKWDLNSENAQIDLEKLSFPLQVRSWQLGDRFVPLGMKKSKKVSDFLIDLKVPQVHKRQVNVVLSEGKIAWVIGYRIANWVKCDESTRKILHFKKKVT